MPPLSGVVLPKVYATECGETSRKRHLAGAVCADTRCFSPVAAIEKAEAIWNFHRDHRPWKHGIVLDVEPGLCNPLLRARIGYATLHLTNDISSSSGRPSSSRAKDFRDHARNSNLGANLLGQLIDCVR